MNHENIILSIRPHALSLFNPIITFIATMGVVVGARWYFQFNFFGYFSQVLAGVFLISSLHLLAKLYIWHKTVLYITERRIVFRRQLGLFSQSTTELLHKDVVSVSFHQSGFDQSISSVGAVNIRTLAGENISIPDVKDPNEVVRKLNDIRQSGVCIME